MNEIAYVGPGSPFGGGGLGAIPLATRSDNNHDATFADIAARDAYYATDPGGLADLAALEGVDEAVGIGTVDANGETTALTAAFIRRNSAWVSIATNFIGPTGPAGPAGDDFDLSALAENELVKNAAGVAAGARVLSTADEIQLPGLIRLLDSGPLHFGSGLNSMRIRRITANGHLVFERLTTLPSTWTEIFRVSDSATVDVLHLVMSAAIPAVTAGQLCLFNMQVTDDDGTTQLLRTFVRDADGNNFQIMGSQADGTVRVITNLDAVLADPTNVPIEVRLMAGMDNIRTDEQIRDVTAAQFVAGTNVNIDVDDDANTITISAVGGGGGTPPQAQHTNYIAVTTDNLAASVDTNTAVSSDDLNPTVTLPTFTGNRYVQILQSMAHTRFTSILLGGINQFGGFTVTDNARLISGQQYRQYVTTSLITDALSGQELTMGGAT